MIVIIVVISNLDMLAENSMFFYRNNLFYN